MCWKCDLIKPLKIQLEYKLNELDDILVELETKQSLIKLSEICIERFIPDTLELQEYQNGINLIKFECDQYLEDISELCNEIIFIITSISEIFSL